MLILVIFIIISANQILKIKPLPILKLDPSNSIEQNCVLIFFSYYFIFRIALDLVKYRFTYIIESENFLHLQKVYIFRKDLLVSKTITSQNNIIFSVFDIMKKCGMSIVTHLFIQIKIFFNWIKINIIDFTSYGHRKNLFIKLAEPHRTRFCL